MTGSERLSVGTIGNASSDSQSHETIPLPFDLPVSGFMYPEGTHHCALSGISYILMIDFILQFLR